MRKNKEEATVLARFQPGAPVRLTENVNHAEFRNLHGRVVKTVKSRYVVRVMCSNGRLYDAFPENVELMTETEA